MCTGNNGLISESSTKYFLADTGIDSIRRQNCETEGGNAGNLQALSAAFLEHSAPRNRNAIQTVSQFDAHSCSCRIPREDGGDEAVKLFIFHLSDFPTRTIVVLTIKRARLF